jgi:hypothetical protein
MEHPASLAKESHYYTSWGAVRYRNTPWSPTSQSSPSTQLLQWTASASSDVELQPDTAPQ